MEVGVDIILEQQQEEIAEKAISQYFNSSFHLRIKSLNSNKLILHPFYSGVTVYITFLHYLSSKKQKTEFGMSSFHLFLI